MKMSKTRGLSGLLFLPVAPSGIFTFLFPLLLTKEEVRKTK
ncbi:hypothetical protein HOLDEFILI_02565 [Holdemania filiformis DSM 12042]|uniref:Uncharacterized protein n=1 Tax=Holdemania filiformis DSM 12042 TaxID=545696 RepID=B9Y9Q8_9FIRM|nr:hypothetical protein HOLDEFILI_02565 [Holdemania filiformis DSM 12042]